MEKIKVGIYDSDFFNSLGIFMELCEKHNVESFQIKKYGQESLEVIVAHTSDTHWQHIIRLSPKNSTRIRVSTIGFPEGPNPKFNHSGIGLFYLIPLSESLHNEDWSFIIESLKQGYFTAERFNKSPRKLISFFSNTKNIKTPFTDDLLDFLYSLLNSSKKINNLSISIYSLSSSEASKIIVVLENFENLIEENRQLSHFRKEIFYTIKKMSKKSKASLVEITSLIYYLDASQLNSWQKKYYQCIHSLNNFVTGLEYATYSLKSYRNKIQSNKYRSRISKNLNELIEKLAQLNILTTEFLIHGSPYSSIFLQKILTLDFLINIEKLWIKEFRPHQWAEDMNNNIQKISECITIYDQNILIKPPEYLQVIIQDLSFMIKASPPYVRPYFRELNLTKLPSMKPR